MKNPSKDFRPVSVLTLEKLQEHEGHTIEIVSYGQNNIIADYALECVTCYEVLADWEHKDAEIKGASLED